MFLWTRWLPTFDCFTKLKYNSQKPWRVKYSWNSIYIYILNLTLSIFSVSLIASKRPRRLGWPSLPSLRTAMRGIRPHGNSWRKPPEMRKPWRMATGGIRWIWCRTVLKRVQTWKILEVTILGILGTTSFWGEFKKRGDIQSGLIGQNSGRSEKRGFTWTKRNVLGP